MGLSLCTARNSEQISGEETKLRDELEYLRKENTYCEHALQTFKENRSSEHGLTLTNLSDKELREKSETNISKYIESILADPKTNISWLPDSVERKIYKNVAMLLLNAMETTVENTEVHMLGHSLRFVVDPIQNTIPVP